MFKIINNSSDFSQINDFESICRHFLPHAQEYLGFDKPVNVELVSDPQNAKDPFGKTAYYDPNEMKITLFVDQRHVKDILRSLSHELVHHSQNCRGEFEHGVETEPGYAQKNPHMRKCEGEAYLHGNGFMWRDFEDNWKQKNLNLENNSRNRIYLLQNPSKEKQKMGKINKKALLNEMVDNIMNRLITEGIGHGGSCDSAHAGKDHATWVAEEQQKTLEEEAGVTHMDFTDEEGSTIVGDAPAGVHDVGGVEIDIDALVASLQGVVDRAQQGERDAQEVLDSVAKVLDDPEVERALAGIGQRTPVDDEEGTMATGLQREGIGPMPGEMEEWCKENPDHKLCKGTEGQEPGTPDDIGSPTMEGRNWAQGEKNQKLFESLVKKWCK
tara:strand:+ start:5635 stop:6786 length:1152 start_codon:yes stop_codon:yes gene_type:complete